MGELRNGVSGSRMGVQGQEWGFRVKNVDSRSRMERKLGSRWIRGKGKRGKGRKVEEDGENQNG